MARTLKSDLPSGNFHFGNGSSIINPAFPILDLGNSPRASDFTINPPNVKIDADLKKIVTRESERLRLKVLKNLTSESEWDLGKVLKLAPDGPKDNAKAKLARDGKSAVISEVSKAINASSIDHTSKFLLSNEPLYVYALSYVIYQEEVKDSDGMDDRILTATENKIRPYFNKLLAKQYILDRHIDLSKEQKKQILKAAESTNISFLPGEPAKAIGKIVAKYVDYGDLNLLVEKFFEAGTIDPEKGTPQIRQLMVKYLIDIGLMVPKTDLIEAGGSPTGTPAGSSGGSTPAAGSSGPRTGPSDEKLRETGMGASGSSSGSSLPKDPASELAKRISEMDISPRKEGAASPGTSLENPKSSKTGK